MDAPQAIVDAAYTVLDANGTLSGNGTKERAHPWQDSDLPAGSIEWDNEQAGDFVDGEYYCQMDLIFVAQAQGNGANAKVGLWREAAQTAIAASGNLSNVITKIRFREASRELDEQGRAITGTIRVVFACHYEADANGALVPRP